MESNKKYFKDKGFPSFQEQVSELKNVILQYQIYDEKRNKINAFQPMKIPGQSNEIELILQEWQFELKQKWEALNSINHIFLPNQKPIKILINYLHLLFNRMGMSFSIEC